MDELAPQDKAALTATRVAVGASNTDFASLAQRIGELRMPKRGRPPLWAAKLLHWSDDDLAAAILYHLVRARLQTEGGDFPYFSTIGTTLGTHLVAPNPEDPDEQLTIGCQLLGVAEEVRLTARMQGADGSYRVAFTEPTFRRIERIINGGAKHVLRRVCTHVPVGVETKKKHSMLLPRPDAPPRVVEAVDKVQGTAWRINRAVLGLLDTPEGRLFEPSLHKELILGEAQALATTLERFYFPVFLDFRGRVNQRSGLLQYTNAPDYARALLEFADGQFVDDTGLKWLTWHMAQMWGRKKDLPYMVLGDGTAWLRNAAKLIHRWQEAKHPAQFFAAALAVVDASEGRPVHLPVRVDASCSGLQHLALLSRDEDLARLVNLWGDYHGDRRGMNWLETENPDDNFYQRVAELTGFERDHVKAVIMPMLYGAGEETSAEGLAEERKTRRTKRQEQDAGRIRDAAKQLAPRAFALLDWFGAVAEAHNAADMPVRWTTPSGFQAIQDYRVVDRSRDRPGSKVQIIVNGERRNIRKQIFTDRLKTWQQGISMPSSIVHSLDAALLTEIVAGSSTDQWGVVHDAFAVPANHVWGLVDEDNPRAMATLYSPDRLAEWVTAWRAEGVPVDDPPGGDRGPLPREMLGGLRTLG